MQERGVKTIPEDIERLSPLGYDHINLLGRYTFSLSDEIRQGAFHPLRELEETEQEEDTKTTQEEIIAYYPLCFNHHLAGRMFMGILPAILSFLSRIMRESFLACFSFH